MQENICFKLRLSCIFLIILYGSFAIVFDIIIYRIIIGLEKTTIYSFIIFLLIAIFSNYMLITKIVQFIVPEKNNLVKKYGGLSKLKEIVKEINRTKIYNDNSVIMSNKYISSIRNYASIIPFDDIINAYQFIKKTNGIITARYLTIITASGKKVEYVYKTNEENKINEALKKMASVQNDIKIGYIR